MESVAPGIRLVAVRSPTLPPATHTNTWILGSGALTVVDPASPFEDEQARLFSELRALAAGGERVERILLTHHHADHVGGARDLQQRLAAIGVEAPIVGHAATAALVPELGVDPALADGDVLVCGEHAFDVLHTPGHAPGHLALHERSHGAIVAGDLVAGVGTIVISPFDGDLGQYLASLERVRARGGTALLPAHGPILPNPEVILTFYVAHRHQRSAQIRAALDAGSATPDQLVPVIYPELMPAIRPVAAAQILTHLRWLANEGVAAALPDGRWARV